MLDSEEEGSGSALPRRKLVFGPDAFKDKVKRDLEADRLKEKEILETVTE